MREADTQLVGVCAGCGKEFFLGADRRVPKHTLRGSPGRCPASGTPAVDVHEVRD